MTTGWKTAIACALLLSLFAALSWTSAIRESATFDEPLHVVAAQVVSHRHDFRVNPEDPPLWQYWANLPHSADSLKPDYTTDVFRVLATEPNVHWKFVIDTLYHSGIDADAFLNASRAMMLVIGVMLGVALAWTAYQLGGPIAAICATTLFSLCPNFLGHSPLVKNDVTFSLEVFCLMLALWRAGNRLTPWNTLAVAVAVIAGMTSKFSGALMPPMIILTISARVAFPQSWTVLGKELATRRQRLLAGSAVLLLIAFTTFLGIWAIYGFRFAPTPEGTLIDCEPIFSQIAVNRLRYIHPLELPSPAAVEFAKTQQPLLVRLIAFGLSRHLLPQAWLAGFLYTYMSSIVRGTFLLGQANMTGSWFFFPAAALFKTPLATMIAFVSAIALTIQRRKSLRPWIAIAFTLPWAVYAIAALATHLNIGLRHIFPLYPPAFLLIGVMAAKFWQQHRSARWIIPLLGLALAAETLPAYPHYIAFFNTPSQRYGPLNLLGDSNLDWGQDLPLLVQWQKEHPDIPLYIAYFGSAPPGYYGLRYVNLPGGYMFEPEANDFTPKPGVIAISATSWQGIYSTPAVRQFYFRTLPHFPVIDILGGTIFLLQVPGAPPK